MSGLIYTLYKTERIQCQHKGIAKTIINIVYVNIKVTNNHDFI